jgi:hypothetical protein
MVLDSGRASLKWAVFLNTEFTEDAEKKGSKHTGVEGQKKRKSSELVVRWLGFVEILAKKTKKAKSRSLRSGEAHGAHKPRPAGRDDSFG